MDRFYNIDAMQPGDSVVLLVSGTRPDEESGRWAKRTPVTVTRLTDCFAYVIPDSAGPRPARARPGPFFRDIHPGEVNPGHRGLYETLREYGATLVEAVEESALVRRCYRANRRKAIDYRAGLSGRAAAIICKGADSAAACLEAARASVARGDVPLHAGPIWAGRGGSDGAPFENGGPGGTRLRWIENPESKGLRFVGLAHDVAPANYAYLRPAVEHGGWFLDSDFQDETVSGVVYQLPARRGVTRYVVGYADPFNCDRDGRGPAALDLFDVIEGENGGRSLEFDPALREAASRADSIAEHMAEAERDYQDSFRAGSRARELAQEAFAAGRALVAACRDVRGMWRARAGFPGLPAPAAREALRGLVADLRAAREDYAEKLDAAREAREAGHGWRCADCRAFADGYAEGGV